MNPELDLASAHALFLAPGVGAQGATSKDVAEVFTSCPARVPLGRPWPAQRDTGVVS